MTHEEFISILRAYESELARIVDRFTHTKDGIYIQPKDGSRLQQLVIELRDLYDDALGQNTYSSMTVTVYNEGTRNFHSSASLYCVERLKSIVASVITRTERNPEILKSHSASQSNEETNTSSDLDVPGKVTMVWLYQHVPYTFWISILGIILAAFSLGIAATTKLSIVQEWVGIHVTSVHSGK